jgi:hypothetical protein
MNANKFQRAIEVWRRSGRTRTRTADLTKEILDNFRREGIVIGDSAKPDQLITILEDLGYTITPPDQSSAQFGRNPKIASDGCPAAKGDGVTDDYAALQAHADWLRAHGGGWLTIPAGKYMVSRPVVIRGDVSVCGEKFATSLWAIEHNGVLVLDNTGTHCLRDIWLQGDMSPNPSGVTLETIAGSENFIDGIRCWFGNPAFLNRGDDGTVSNSFFWARDTSILNFSTGWWKRVKIDGVDGIKTRYAFLCGSPSMENYFEQCDFTAGNLGYDYAFMGAGCTGAFFKFTDCIFSHPVDVSGIGFAKFAGCTFSSTVSTGATPAAFSDCYAFVPIAVAGSNRLLTNNFNIN